MRRTFAVLAAVSISLWACSEATDGLTPTLDAGSSGASDSSDSDASSGSSGADATTSSSSPILINEISAADEWVELVNAGSRGVSLAGWKLADRDKTSGEPKLGEAVTFPDGTTLGPKGYGMVRAGGVDGGKPCPDGGQSFCLNAEFGISKKNGEMIFLIASDGGVVGSVVYPPDAATGGDETWARIPNGDPNGTFQVGTATPGAANKTRDGPSP